MSTIQQKFIRFFRFWLMLVVLSFATAGCDLWTKHWASQNLSTPTTSGSLTNQRISQHQLEAWTRAPNNTKVIVPQYLDLQYAENNAGMFSLGQSQHRPYRRAVLIIGAIVGMVFITHLYAKTAITDPLSRIGLSVLLGGAIGNFVDRIHRGFVVDFIHAHWQGRYHWPTFNVADIAISVGIGLFFLSQLLTAKREQSQPSSA